MFGLSSCLKAPPAKLMRANHRSWGIRLPARLVRVVSARPKTRLSVGRQLDRINDVKFLVVNPKPRWFEGEATRSSSKPPLSLRILDRREAAVGLRDAGRTLPVVAG